ncbi:efflux RND transporter periplasmic adaptor subunit [uncultured Paludibaculum sp.]|uniref:efflux RND transporter periplasmic adaptor subunit n=1 Tax=uncultured Paludibaculum sp. TaxID=1765020 RepID=UPI002AAAD4BB|nr:efflux RND transporter periplasmic adaptor subunit [uncultured Paludibaculum sp.]
MKRTKNLILASALISLTVGWSQTSDVVSVVAKSSSQTVDLPGEFQPFLNVDVHAKVRGYVERVLVDRGSFVKQGQLLAELSAPEMKAQIAEAESKLQASESERLQAEAELAAAQSTAERMAKAAETPGAVAGNEVVLARKRVDALKALVQSRQRANQAAESAVEAQRELASYLRITASFDGVVTERFVHPGALVGPGSDPVLLNLQQLVRLRLVVAVPEQNVSGIAPGARVEFRVPAFPDRAFAGTVARVSHSLDQKTRTMPVELDVSNSDASLAPGMYPSVKWPVRRTRPVLLVPKTSVVTTTERTFVIRVRNGRAEWVDVTKGSADGDLVEVLGHLQAGEMVVRRATDEIRDGSVLAAPRGKS